MAPLPWWEQKRGGRLGRGGGEPEGRCSPWSGLGGESDRSVGVCRSGVRKEVTWALLSVAALSEGGCMHSGVQRGLQKLRSGVTQSKLGMGLVCYILISEKGEDIQS